MPHDMRLDPFVCRLPDNPTARRGGQRCMELSWRRFDRLVCPEVFRSRLAAGARPRISGKAAGAGKRRKRLAGHLFAFRFVDIPAPPECQENVCPHELPYVPDGFSRSPGMARPGGNGSPASWGSRVSGRSDSRWELLAGGVCGTSPEDTWTLKSKAAIADAGASPRPWRWPPSLRARSSA